MWQQPVDGLCIGQFHVQLDSWHFFVVSQVAAGLREKLNVFGSDYPTPDGTGVRDYIHVIDLAQGHIKALERFRKSPGMVTANLGTGRGYSVLEMINAFEKASVKSSL